MSFDIKKNSALEGMLEIEHVSFGYATGKKEVLQDINLRIPAKKHIAIVGKSGCGKTTLANILLGVLEPQSGTIKVGGEDIRLISDHKRSKTICAVMQDSGFFHLTIAQNLRLVKPDATKEELDQVCKQAHIYDFIQSLPEKYDTLMGEKGIKLSGGQRQRMAIARTLLRDPAIILFDEATSALDNESEKAVISAIHNIAKKKTIISIAHRFATIMEADEVVLLQDGKVAAQGTVKELLESSEAFYSLYQLQLN